MTQYSKLHTKTKLFFLSPTETTHTFPSLLPIAGSFRELLRAQTSRDQYLAMKSPESPGENHRAALTLQRVKRLLRGVQQRLWGKITGNHREGRRREGKVAAAEGTERLCCSIVSVSAGLTSSSPPSVPAAERRDRGSSYTIQGGRRKRESKAERKWEKKKCQRCDVKPAVSKTA